MADENVQAGEVAGPPAGGNCQITLTQLSPQLFLIPAGEEERRWQLEDEDVQTAGGGRIWQET